MTADGKDTLESQDVPAYFLDALLTTDIPPYLTEASGTTKLFSHDPLASTLAVELNRLPTKRAKKGKGKKKR
jgi:hypothetical protein